MKFGIFYLHQVPKPWTAHGLACLHLPYPAETSRQPHLVLALEIIL